MARHELKTWPSYFKGLVDGSKRFELRKNDRDFREGDLLVLREWDPGTLRYTGRVVEAHATCLVDGVEEWGLMDGFCIMSIRRIN